MRKLINTTKFLELLLKRVNEIYDCYYEEAPQDATYPYLVIPTINVTDLDYGDQCFIDLEVNNNELSKISVEEICDNLRNQLNGYAIYEDGIGFHLSFENQNIQNLREQDLISRRVSFSARIFYN